MVDTIGFIAVWMIAVFMLGLSVACIKLGQTIARLVILSPVSRLGMIEQP